MSSDRSILANELRVLMGSICPEVDEIKLESDYKS